MSDLYDSLEEDESNQRENRWNELDLREATGMECESKSTENYSFHLNGDVIHDKINFDGGANEKKFVLPKIENETRDRGLELLGNIIVNNQILSKQGLQMNDDGSFTKSPRSEADELPFITREYRNLQFQKRKTYRLTKRTSADKKPVGITSENEIIKARQKKNNNEKVLSTCGSVSPDLSQGKKKSEKGESSPEKSPSTKPMRNLKKTKREINLTEIQEMLERNKALHVKKKEVLAGRSDRSDRSDKSKNVRNAERQVLKYQSDVLLSGVKRGLNYSEQNRLKNGYNPFCLRQWSRKVLSDTNRSNFGDSMVEELPELPNLNFSVESGADEEEEMFYKKLIESDKNLKEKNYLSFRSDGPIERKNFTSMANCQAQVLEKKHGRTLREKPFLKSLSIDLTPEAKPSMCFSKKSSHYCMTQSSPTASKMELVLKGKTYGYMVNARNVFNLKAQAKRKLEAAEKTETTKIRDNIFVSEKKASDLSPNLKKITKHKSSPVNRLLNVTEGLPQTVIKPVKARKPVERTGISEVCSEKQKKGFLPRVNDSVINKRQENQSGLKSPKKMPS